jgi:hypothetical protein
LLVSLPQWTHREGDLVKANVFRRTSKLGIEEVERPRPGAGEAIIRVTLELVAIRP